MMPSSPDFQDFLNHLTNNALASLKHANGIAMSFGSAYIGTEHLLLGLLAQNTSMGGKILEDAGVTLDRAKAALDLSPKTLTLNIGAKGLSETAKLTLKLAYDIAQDYGQEVCGTEHILYSILEQKNARATKVMEDMQVDVDGILRDLQQLFSRQSFEEDMSSPGAGTRLKARRPKSTLERFGTDITEAAKSSKLDPVVGRENQIRRLIAILNRRTKNNPVLIGEPGVGKTAIVEGLAQRIIKEDVPDSLLDKRIFMLDLASMIAGTKYRGEFEERLKKVMHELEKDEKTMVFIDEMHLLVGAGAAEGAMDPGNILKPALARGKIQVIGATTTQEYTKHIEKDSALERRFQPIIVPEATASEALAILKGLKKYYEEFHGVQISDDVLKETVDLAKRYLSERFMPDKAIDLLDETAAYLRIDGGRTSPQVRALSKEMKLMNARIDQAVDDEDYQKAAEFKTRASQIHAELKQLRANDKQSQNLVMKNEDVASVVSRTTGIPATKVIKSEARYLLNLEKNLSKHVIGQTEAVEAVAKAVRRNRSGVGSDKRPIGSFVFLGPTGVGKTELARVLATEFFGSSDALIKIDMSEFGERHTSSRLVGAPAGYVGYDEGGQLTDKVRRRPYSLVLFDEIEKAHPDVFNMLLQILEDGVLTDGKGRQIDFTNTIIIMTSNIGADKLQKEASLGFQVTSESQRNDLSSLHAKNKSAVHAELKKMMRPELLNRIDKVVVFRALTRQDIYKIINLQVDELKDRLHSKGVSVKLQPAARRYLLENGYDSKNGVRPMRRLIQDTIEDHIALKLLEDKYATGDIVKVATKKGELVYDTINE